MQPAQSEIKTLFIFSPQHLCDSFDMIFPWWRTMKKGHMHFLALTVPLTWFDCTSSSKTVLVSFLFNTMIL